MKILICPHELEIGGSQTNAIELAAATRDLGHDVTVVASPGPLLSLVQARRLPFVALPARTGNGDIRRAARALRSVLQRRPADLVHAYEYRAVVEAYAATRTHRGLPLVATELSMSVPSRFPRSVPLIMGTRSLGEDARRLGVRRVEVLEPPVDTAQNSPDYAGPEFLRAHGLDPAVPTAVIVSRLASLLKREGLETAIESVRVLEPRLPIQLAIVGGGPEHQSLWRRADAVNAALGRRAVVLTGPLVDPRPAYAAADVAIGMGHSALRAMAFAKPVLVIGEGGFSEPVTPETTPSFLRDGFYGDGHGRPDPQRVAAQVAELLADTDRGRRLGDHGRNLVCERFSLEATARRLERIYERAIADRPSILASAVESWRISSDLAVRKARGRVRRLRSR
jgi:glycosyltransferase involved in cell wall biosynthesis